jgi:conjugal transfer/type IV secretion protein DotA/TraY
MVPVTGVPTSGMGGSVFTAIFGPTFFLDLVTGLGKYVTTGCYSNSTSVTQQNQNPIICIAGFGANLVNTAENVFWIAMGLLFLLQFGLAFMSCINPVGQAIQAAISLLVPLATLAITLLWGIGITMGLYIPMIPMLVFTFSAFTWIILVIEAMLGAPLIALTLIIPSEDEIGKATHGIMIIFGLVLRPGLMILGFIFAIELIMVAVGMLNFGFSASIKNVVHNGIGPFGAIGILFLYAYLITTFIHESFTLIHALPDKVLRWIAGQGEGSQASELTKGLGASVDKGAEVGKSAMSGGLSAAGKKRKGGGEG